RGAGGGAACGRRAGRRRRVDPPRRGPDGGRARRGRRRRRPQGAAARRRAGGTARRRGDRAAGRRVVGAGELGRHRGGRGARGGAARAAVRVRAGYRAAVRARRHRRPAAPGAGLPARPAGGAEYRRPRGDAGRRRDPAALVRARARCRGRRAPVAAAEHPSALAARGAATALVAHRVQDVVLAPGSRSAPLAYALAAAERAGWLRVHVRVDERVAGFVALGIARERPAAVVTTSGTAVANLHPAVLEAHHSGLPLVVLSADRPHEMRGVGANQTTDQPGIFGGAVRLAVEVPAADGAPRGVRSAVTRAVVAATGARSGDPGPVQVNVGFRDPLVPAAPWHPGAAPPAVPQLPPTEPGGGQALVDGTRRGVVVAGDRAHAVGAHRRGVAEVGPATEQVAVLGRPPPARAAPALLARTGGPGGGAGPGPGWADGSGTGAVVARGVAARGATDADWLRQWQEA